MGSSASKSNKYNVSVSKTKRFGDKKSSPRESSKESTVVDTKPENSPKSVSSGKNKF